MCRCTSQRDSRPLSRAELEGYTRGLRDVTAARLVGDRLVSSGRLSGLLAGGNRARLAIVSRPASRKPSIRTARGTSASLAHGASTLRSWHARDNRGADPGTIGRAGRHAVRNCSTWQCCRTRIPSIGRCATRPRCIAIDDLSGGILTRHDDVLAMRAKNVKTQRRCRGHALRARPEGFSQPSQAES